MTTPSSAIPLSVIVLAWDQLPHTRRFVSTVQQHTDVDYELIVVDNGSGPEAADFARGVADRAVLNDMNRGFAAGMNQGLEIARGEFVAFCNNDTAMPQGWASLLIEDFETHPEAGIVLPAVTAAGNPRTVRSERGQDVEVLLPFGEFPSGVVYLMRRRLALALGGWSTDYPVASAEDLDLCFTVWANDRAVVFDQRVLVEHASQATVRTKLQDHRRLYRQNLERFLEKWGSDSPAVPRLEECPPDRFAHNLAQARVAVQWIRRMIEARDELEETRRRVRDLEREVARLNRQSPNRDSVRFRRSIPKPVRRLLSPLVRRFLR